MESAVVWAVIIGFSMIGIYVWGQNREANNQKLGVPAKQIKRTSGLAYLGGLPDAPEAKPRVRLVVTPNEIALEHGPELFIRRSMSDVYELTIETEEEARHRLTVTRMLTLGVFALAFPKKKAGSVLVTIDCKQGPILLEAEQMSKAQLLTSLGPSLAIIKERALGSRNGQSRADLGGSTPPAHSVADELAKLGKLLAEGLISQAEFDQAKARILSDGN